MTDIAAIASLLSSIKTATDLAKLVSESGLTLERAEFKLKLADLVSSLADAKLELSSVQEAIQNKNREIQELKDALALQAAMVFESPSYWRIVDNGKDGPFCQQCYDANGKTIRLQSYGEGHEKYLACKTCGSTF
jgi:hypothetical protein